MPERSKELLAADAAVMAARMAADPMPPDVWQLLTKEIEVARFSADGIQRMRISAPAYLKIWI